MCPFQVVPEDLALGPWEITAVLQPLSSLVPAHRTTLPQGGPTSVKLTMYKEWIRRQRRTMSGDHVTPEIPTVGQLDHFSFRLLFPIALNWFPPEQSLSIPNVSRSGAGEGKVSENRYWFSSLTSSLPSHPPKALSLGPDGRTWPPGFDWWLMGIEL